MKALAMNKWKVGEHPAAAFVKAAKRSKSSRKGQGKPKAGRAGRRV